MDPEFELLYQVPVANETFDYYNRSLKSSSDENELIIRLPKEKGTYLYVEISEGLDRTYALNRTYVKVDLTEILDLHDDPYELCDFKNHISTIKVIKGRGRFISDE